LEEEKDDDDDSFVIDEVLLEYPETTAAIRLEEI
jgi:hypothetical protein